MTNDNGNGTYSMPRSKIHMVSHVSYCLLGDIIRISFCCRWQTWCGTLSSNLLPIIKPVKHTHFWFQSEIVVRCLMAQMKWHVIWFSGEWHQAVIAKCISIGTWSWGSLKDLETWTVFALCLGFPLIWMPLKPSFLCRLSSEGIISSSGFVPR